MNTTLSDGSTAIRDGEQLVAIDRENKRTILDGAVAIAIQTGITDADGAFFFQRQLEHIKARSYDVRYADLKARTLFPVSNEAGKGVDTITYRTYDQVGVAKIISAYANDLPRADVSGKETRIPVQPIGASYGYNLDEIQAAQLTGVPLDQRRANACIRSINQVINDVAFFGDSTTKMPGLFSNTNIPKGVVPNPGSGTEWENKTPKQIIDDVNDIFGDIFETTKMLEQGNTLLIPPSQWSYIMSTPRSDNSDTTIAQYILNNSPYLNSMADIIAVNECASANNPLNTTDVMVAYNRSPDKLQLEVPVEIEMLPVQMRNLEFVIPARARLGGLNIYYPLSLAINSGI